MYQESTWYYDRSRMAFCKTVAGERDVGAEAEIDFELDRRSIPGLIDALDRNGFIQPRLDDRLRVEDLKITHRLLDIIDNKVEGKNDK